MPLPLALPLLRRFAVAIALGLPFLPGTQTPCVFIVADVGVIALDDLDRLLRIFCCANVTRAAQRLQMNTLSMAIAKLLCLEDARRATGEVTRPRLIRLSPMEEHVIKPHVLLDGERERRVMPLGVHLALFARAEAVTNGRGRRGRARRRVRRPARQQFGSVRAARLDTSLEGGAVRFRIVIL